MDQTTGATGYADQVVATDVGMFYKLVYSHKNGTFTGRLAIGTTLGAGDIYTDITLNDAGWVTRTVIFVATTTTTHITFECAGSTQNTLYDEVSVKSLSTSIQGDLGVSGDMMLSNLSVFSNNAAAIAGGLSVGQLYRTGLDPDTVCIVH